MLPTTRQAIRAAVAAFNPAAVEAAVQRFNDYVDQANGKGIIAIKQAENEAMAVFRADPAITADPEAALQYLTRRAFQRDRRPRGKGRSQTRSTK